jgi:hypothetical protein
MRNLEERKPGFQLCAGFVPNLPAAVLIDLGVGDFHHPTGCRGRIPGLPCRGIKLNG